MKALLFILLVILMLLLMLSSLFSLIDLLHIGHVDILGVLLIYEDIRFHEFDASIVNGDLHIEIRAQKLKKLLSFYVRIEGVSAASKNEQRPKKINENRIHYGVVIDSFLYPNSSLPQYAEKLHDELFELEVVEYLWVIFFVEHELELVIIDQFFDLAYVPFEVYIFQFEAELEVLIIEDSDVGLRIIAEMLDYARWVYEVILEEDR